MRLLLIGSSGFLGSHVGCAAAEAGVEVITAGRRPAGGATEHVVVDLVEDGPARISTVLADVHPDAVVNCAGTTSGEPAALAAGNIVAPATLVEAMLRDRSPARLIHLGSAAEYGLGNPGVPVRESCPAPPGRGVRRDQTGRYPSGAGGSRSRTGCGRAAGVQPGRPRLPE